MAILCRQDCRRLVEEAVNDMKPYLCPIILFLLVACAPKEPVNPLSEYAAEMRRAKINATDADSSRVEADVEKIIPVVHISYDTPVEGYDISIEWFPTDRKPYPKGKPLHILSGEAEISLRSRSTHKTITLEEDIILPDWRDTERVVEEETVILHYETMSTGDIIPRDTKQILLFADVDFDGKKELVINWYGGGRGFANAYRPYKLVDGKAVFIEYPDNDDWNVWFQDYLMEFIPEKRQFIRWGPISEGVICRVYQFDGTGRAPKLVKVRTVEDEL